MNKRELKPTMDSRSDNESLNAIPNNEEHVSDNDSFNFIKVFIAHIKNVFKNFHGSDLQCVNNSEYVELGRTEEEKEQINEMCIRVDEEKRLLTELKQSGLTPEEWIMHKGEEIFNECSPEERDEILYDIEEEGAIETEEQVDALETIVDEIQEEQVDNAKTVVDKGQNNQESLDKG